MTTTTAEAESIDDIFNEFLTEQHARLKDSTFGRYAMIIDLFRGCLNGYGYTYLNDEADLKRWEEAFDQDEEAFCRLFGAPELIAGLDEFLNYDMIRKVIASQEDLKAAPTVTKKLLTWLSWAASGKSSSPGSSTPTDNGPSWW